MRAFVRCGHQNRLEASTRGWLAENRASGFHRSVELHAELRNVMLRATLGHAGFRRDWRTVQYMAS